MKIVIKSDSLNSCLNYISDILPSKPTMTVTAGIFIETKDNTLSLISTDLENTIKVTTECEVKEKGETVIPGKQFISLIKQFKKEEIKIEKLEKFVNVLSENSKYSFLEMEVEEFPKFPKFSADITLKIKGEILKEAFKKIIFCIDPEEPRPHFRGGLFDIKEKTINIVGTDTRRLSLFSILYEGQLKKQIKVLFPYNLLKKLINILEDEEDVEISIGKNNVAIQLKNILLISNLLAGGEEFPDYEKVIPDIKKSKIAKINTETFLKSLKRVSLFTSERNNKVKLSFKKDNLILEVSGDIGQAQEKLNIEYNEEEIDFAFPPEFLQDFLETIENENFIFAFTGSSKPVLMKPEEEANFTYVCMPLKIE